MLNCISTVTTFSSPPWVACHDFFFHLGFYGVCLVFVLLLFAVSMLASVFKPLSKLLSIAPLGPACLESSGRCVVCLFFFDSVSSESKTLVFSSIVFNNAFLGSFWSNVPVCASDHNDNNVINHKRGQKQRRNDDKVKAVPSSLLQFHGNFNS